MYLGMKLSVDIKTKKLEKRIDGSSASGRSVTDVFVCGCEFD